MFSSTVIRCTYVSLWYIFWWINPFMEKHLFVPLVLFLFWNVLCLIYCHSNLLMLTLCMYVFFYPFSLSWPVSIFRVCFFKKDFIYLFLERGEGREKERERNINVWLPLTHPQLGDLACNPGICPDWESNWRPLGFQAGTQSTEPHQPGLNCAACGLLFFIQSDNPCLFN